MKPENQNELRSLYGKDMQEGLTLVENMKYLAFQDQFFMENARLYNAGDYEADTEEIGYVFPNMPERVWAENSTGINLTRFLE